ncbi:thioredoxin-dependent thiol peroxidase [Cognatishimia activa]|uniref:thioredoxin-dependent peroxiredoxin n=1 Tax=Cognatishimia activa TaxID=1715691 RepID=A0A0P1ITS6_9RHOB|nr:thioredoxin-dependent thiol peroxidase [Cognatishimia activa]CUJ37460.1 Putative peroxiredoxin bcp [Cognatishimia activa]CUK26967.1 Putative peroxiredoxin bcp [Cognatishimia activa]
MLNIGDKAPDFTLPETDGEAVTLSSLKPSPVVLFFYPRDNTKGCTVEAIDFTNAKSEFDAAGVKVFGISKDSLKSHANFRDKKELTVPLLSDEENTVCEDYGVWAEKSMYGKKFFGIVRTTVLIDADGNVAKVWNRVKVPGHVDEVLAAAKELTA